MSTAAPVPATWTPEYDLLLKNAIEAGASLEELGKNVVKLRRFTFKELRDRWHSLLYDPDVSGRASAEMCELELPRFIPSSRFMESVNYKGHKNIPENRKRIIRKQYYAFRKRLRSEFFSSTDLGFFNEPAIHDSQDNGSNMREHHDGKFISDSLGLQESDLHILQNVFSETVTDYDTPAVCPSNAEGNSPRQVIGCSSPHSNLPIWRITKNFSVRSMPVCMGNQGTDQVVRTLLPDNGAGKGMRSTMFEIVQSGPSLGLEHNSNDFMHASVSSDGDFVDISNSLLNLSNKYELPFTDIDEKEAVDKIVNDNVKLVLDNSTVDVQGEKVEFEPKMLNSEESSIILQNSPRAVQLEEEVKCNPNLAMVEKTRKCVPNSLLPVKMEDVPLSSLDEHSVVRNLNGDLQIVAVIDGSIQTTSAVRSEPRELDNGVIWCRLNTEDQEIPCNDDIFLLIHPSPIFLSSTSPLFSGDARPLISIPKGNIIEQQMNQSINGKDSSQSFKWHQSVRPSYSRDTHSSNPHFSCVSKPKLLDASHVGVPPENANRSSVDSSVNRLFNVTSNPSTDTFADKEIPRSQLKDKHTEASFLEMPQYAEAIQGAAIEPAINTTLSDSEEFQNDDDVPYASDVEAMILDMDLDLPEEESSISKQAFRFLPEDSKTIMRLEQCARSSLQRTLTCQGAFAILYGRHLNQYIKKTEVVLGRSTDELEVDIDLREEGSTYKISRKQAIIKVEANGFFTLKNIGKVNISVNGKSVYTGQSVILSSSCLIEISLISLAFEINQKYVQRYMDANARKIFENN